MNNDKIEQTKKQAFDQQPARDTGSGSTLSGLSGAAIGYASQSRAGLMERVQSQLHRASGEAARASRLEELNYLLNKNPEIARILDLLEEVKG